MLHSLPPELRLQDQDLGLAFLCFWWEWSCLASLCLKGFFIPVRRCVLSMRSPQSWQWVIWKFREQKTWCRKLKPKRKGGLQPNHAIIRIWYFIHDWNRQNLVNYTHCMSITWILAWQTSTCVSRLLQVCCTSNRQNELFGHGTKPSFLQLSLSLVNPRKVGPFPRK